MLVLAEGLRQVVTPLVTMELTRRTLFPVPLVVFC